MLTNLDKNWENQHLQSPSISQHPPASPNRTCHSSSNGSKLGDNMGFTPPHFKTSQGFSWSQKKDQEKPKNLKIVQRQEDLRWLARVLFPTKIHLQSSLIPFALSVSIQIIYFYYPDSTLKHNYTSLKPISTSKIKHCNLKSMEIHRKSL